MESNLTDVCFTERPGECLGEKRTAKIMSGERCGQLFAFALANRLPELWIAQQPVLLLTYLYQYLPVLTKSMMQLIALSLLWRLRDGRQDLAELGRHK